MAVEVTTYRSEGGYRDSRHPDEVRWGSSLAEDLARRDFTINALVYDIATFSIIDYVGGLEDLHAGVVRSIGDPEVRLREDPVRMLRAIALAARLDFTIEPTVLDAIRTHRHEISHSSAPRLLEEYYKILRAGSAEKTFRMLAEVGLLEPISSELHRGAADPLWRSLAQLDTYRRRFESTPDTLTNAILLGSLLVPLGISLGSGTGRPKERSRHEVDGHGAGVGPHGVDGGRSFHAVPKLGALPLARRDVEQLKQILGLQRRLRDTAASPRAQRALVHRSLFPEALTWFEIHGSDRDTVEKWKAVLAQGPVEGEGFPPEDPDGGRRRRRRRRRRRPVGPVQS